MTLDKQRTVLQGWKDRAKFDKLRASYFAASKVWGAYDITLAVKYGPRHRQWASRGEKTKLEQLSKKRDKAGNGLFALIESISPREWKSGIPVHWILNELTFEDAVRPSSEPLSVVPPRSWGS